MFDTFASMPVSSEISEAWWMVLTGTEFCSDEELGRGGCGMVHSHNLHSVKRNALDVSGMEH